MASCCIIDFVAPSVDDGLAIDVGNKGHQAFPEFMFGADADVAQHRTRQLGEPFEVTQRVRHPPGRGAARQPEASLAWAAVTSLVKRRQRKLKLCVSLEIMYQLRPSAWVARGQYRHDRYRRGRVGSAGVLEQGKGLGWVAREPVRSRARPCANGRRGATRRTKEPRPGCGPCRAGSAVASTKAGEHVEPATENIRERVCVSGKS